MLLLCSTIDNKEPNDVTINDNWILFLFYQIVGYEFLKKGNFGHHQCYLTFLFFMIYLAPKFQKKDLSLQLRSSLNQLWLRTSPFMMNWLLRNPDLNLNQEMLYNLDFLKNSTNFWHLSCYFYWIGVMFRLGLQWTKFCNVHSLSIIWRL